jgi:hypothetical protein
MRTGHKQGKMWLTCFSEIGIPLEAEQLFLLNCLCSEKQEAGFSCYNVMPLPRASAPPCLPLFIKGPLKGGLGTFAFCLWLFALEGFLGFGLWLGTFALGFLVWEVFGREKNY